MKISRFDSSIAGMGSLIRKGEDEFIVYDHLESRSKAQYEIYQNYLSVKYEKERLDKEYLDLLDNEDEDDIYLL